ncbi:type II secretion system protein E [Hahella sp. CCB-MM4]|uniref:GspE/PulE family protein n=1 Tax=Hahella sp. (strain CCB-MM4) TaxID=1926491 RepID=UPI000B9A5129|nr:GspE/PulE family protein [Hahella sp. CCB-MM4]OZG72455.1 type II secretion system protein E [Hahella sp. CCB-MM4]
MNSVSKELTRDWLTPFDVLSRLVRIGRLAQDEADKFLAMPTSKEDKALHPLEQIVKAELKDLKSGKKFDLEQLTEWLAKESGQPYYHIDPLKIDTRGVASLMSFAYAQRHRILGVEIRSDHVVIASAEPFVTGWEENLRHVIRKDIRRVVANPADISRFTVEFYRLASSVDKAIGGQAAAPGIGNFEQLLELGNVANPDANDQHIINIVDWLLQYAFDQRASDIHIEPRREIGQVRFRIDGVLHNVYELPSQVSTAVVSRLKILSRINVAEKRKPQDGRIKTKNPDGLEIELRLSTLPTAFGEKLVMRVFDPEVLLRSFNDLGFGQDDSKRWNSMTRQPNGIILVTGPTGSGKTTTLYSTLKSLATPEVNVCTIEDPIEMVEPAFNQMQVQSNIGVDFASGVRALLRQDPDIIMVGEIRDLETAEMAIQAALTGHLVLSTLHTNDAPSAITRLMELGVPGYLVKATVLGVMAQRLVRILCPQCKQTSTISTEDWQSLIRPWKAPMPDHTCIPNGCLECRNTGYRGRAGVYEILMMSEMVKEAISDNCDLDRVRKIAIKEGMRTLRLSGAQKVANGQTTIDEVLRVTPSSQLSIE